MFNIIPSQEIQPSIYLELFRTFGVTDALIFINSHQTTVLTPQHMFQSLGDHFCDEDKTKQINQLIFLYTRTQFFLVGDMSLLNMLIGYFNKSY